MEFVALPDHPVSEAIAERLSGARRDQPPITIPHASGRPWIVGHWAERDIRTARCGAKQLAVFGAAGVSDAALVQALANASRPADLDALARAAPGSFHLVASIGGHVRVQGTLSTTCQVFHTRVSGVEVAADQPQPLAALIDARVDEEGLAARLLAPWPPWPLMERCAWQDVRPLPAGCYLELDADGQGRPTRWRPPPAPTLPLSAGAELVRAALRDAVAARASAGGTLSADLSGGMDSTSVCFLAADGPARLVTTRWEAADPGNDDGRWASQAAAQLPQARHLVIDLDQAPTWFADQLAPDPDLEGPNPWIRTRAQQDHQTRQVAALGSTRHLTGHGGDELFYALPSYLHTLVRGHPLRAVRAVRAMRALYRWKLAPTLRGLADNQRFGRWLSASADSLGAPLGGLARSDVSGWGVAPRTPPWLTPAAVDAAARQLREAADQRAEPLAPLRGQHVLLANARLCGDSVRRSSRASGRLGVSLEAPFLDDQVIEAAMSIRVADRVVPGQYKPALAAAMRGVVPADLLGRPTKGEFSAEAYAGLRRHRHELAEACESMRLAELGLVDPGAFRAALLGLHVDSRTLIPFDATLACESWLRSLPAAVPAAGGRR